MKNQDWKKFLDNIDKLNNIYIVLQYKPGGVFYEKHFYIWKKRHVIHLYAIYNP